MKYYTEEELAYRAKVAETYAELPLHDRTAYLESLGMTRETMWYWVHHFSKYATQPRPNPHGKTKKAEQQAERRKRKAAAPPPPSRPYVLAGLETEGCLKIMSVKVIDTRGVHKPQRVTALADFRCGCPSRETLAELEAKATEVISGWEYEAPEKGYFADRIKAMWIR